MIIRYSTYINKLQYCEYLVFWYLGSSRRTTVSSYNWLTVVWYMISVSPCVACENISYNHPIRIGLGKQILFATNKQLHYYCSCNFVNRKSISDKHWLVKYQYLWPGIFVHSTVHRSKNLYKPEHSYKSSGKDAFVTKHRTKPKNDGERRWSAVQHEFERLELDEKEELSKDIYMARALLDVYDNYHVNRNGQSDISAEARLSRLTIGGKTHRSCN